MEENRNTIQKNSDDQKQLEAELAAIIGAEEPDCGLDVSQEYDADAYAAEIPEGGEGAGAVSEACGEEAASPEETGDSGREDASVEVQYGLPADHPDMGELNERIRLRRIEKEKKRRRFLARFYIITIGLVLAVSAVILSFTSFFTVDSIEVTGNSHYSAEEIINMGHAVPGRNIIYNTNKKDIVEYLEQNPYIKNADVKRRFPSTLVISVSERTESLAFRYDDDYLIMDDEGILLKKTRNQPMVTVAEGIVVNRIKLGEKIGTENGGRFDRILKLVRTMAASDLYFVRVDMNDESKVKAYIYDTFIVRTDYDTLIANMKNGRLHMVIEKLFSDGIRRGTITFDKDGSASFMPVI